MLMHSERPQLHYHALISSYQGFGPPPRPCVGLQPIQPIDRSHL